MAHCTGSELGARILKAVYFPDSDFLVAEAGSSPSQVWRSILEEKEVLLKGLIRRVGTSVDTNIRTMNWIPRDGMLRPLASVRPNPPELVSDLIDSSACWDRQKLLQFFYPTDVEVISNIPLSTRRQGDFWA